MLKSLEDDAALLLRDEVELLMSERAALLRIAGAAAVLVANLDTRSLPHDQDTIDAAEVLAEYINALHEDLLSDALQAVGAETDPEAQAVAEKQAQRR